MLAPPASESEHSLVQTSIGKAPLFDAAAIRQRVNFLLPRQSLKYFEESNLSAGWLKQLFLLKIRSLFVFLLFSRPDR